MGQDLKYIATKNDLAVPRGIVHFVEKDSLIFPIDLYDSEFEELITEGPKLKTARQIFDLIITELYSEDSVLESIQFLKEKGVETFAIVCFREILEIDQYYPWLVVLRNELLKTESAEIDPHTLASLDSLSGDIASNVKRYYSYDDAFYDYFQKDSSKKLVRKYG